MSENKFTPGAEEALRLSQEAAGELGHGYVGTEHLMLGLIREEEGLAHTVLTEAGLTDELIVEIIKKKDAVKTAAVEKLSVLTSRMDTEASIETLLKAKGFKDVLAIIGDNDINIIIKADELLESESMQIQDVATTQSGLPLDKVKIITVK